MNTGKGKVVETIWEEGTRLVRIACPRALIPAPGQYLLAGDASHAPLPVSLFHTESDAESFIAALPDSVTWTPRQDVFLRGPLGKGFALPASARRVALIAYDDPPLRLRGLILSALKQGAAVVLVSDFPIGNIPDEVEVQPFAALGEVMAWAEYAAFDVARENLFEFRERLGRLKQARAWREAEVFIHMPVPCGGVADCGVCAVSLKSGSRLGCKEGPVFAWGEF
jgi:NAD(P)H-flavin reductase